MSLFDSLGKQPSYEMHSPQQMLQQLKSNPVSTLKQAGYTIPENMNNPGQIIGYLLQSGQINNSRLQMVQRMAGMFGRR